MMNIDLLESWKLQLLIVKMLIRIGGQNSLLQ